MPDVSIAMSAKDGISATLKTIQANVTPLRKDMEQLEGELSKLNASKTTIKVDMTTARKELQEAKRAFEQTGDAASKLAYETAQQKYDNLQSSLQMVSRYARQTEKDIYSLTGTLSKAENTFGSGGGNTIESEGSALSQLGTAGIAKMAGDTLSKVAGAYIGSAFGNEAGNMISGTLSGVASGAAAGLLAGGIPGAIVTGIAGGIGGYIQASAAAFETQDEVFKGIVQEQYESTQTGYADRLSAGSGIAAQRENDLKTFSVLLKDSDTSAKDYQDMMIEMGRTPPFSYSTVTALSKDMFGLGLSSEDAIYRLQALADASAALNLSDSKVSTIVASLESAQLSGTLETRILNTLSKSGINVYDALSQHFGIEQSEVKKKIGSLNVDEGIAAIYEYMSNQFAGASSGLEKTFDGISGILESYEEDLAFAMGQSYNDIRTQGMIEQRDWMESETNTLMQQAYTEIGAWEASLENTKEKIRRNVLDSVLTGQMAGQYSTEEVTSRVQGLMEEYQLLIGSDLEEDMVRRGQLLKEAEILAANEYTASEGAQLMLESELALISSIREDTTLNQSYWNTGYRLAEEFSKGRMAGLKDWQIDAQEAFEMQNQAELNYAGIMQNGRGSADGAHAFGLNSVPRNDYLAVLHEGERVLTAQQAKQMDGSSGAGVSVIVQNAIVREEADIEKVATALYEQIKLARIASVPR